MPAANPYVAHPANAGPVPTARIIQSTAQSEMHIDLRSQTFGNVALHTTVRDSQVGLTVGSDKGDLRNFLAAEVPGLQTALHQHDLHFDGIQFLAPSTGTGGGLSGGTNSQSGFSQPARSLATAGAFEALPPQGSEELETTHDARTGLSVHA
jgi:hypothetical protein